MSSILLYTAPVWRKGLQILGNAHKLSSVYRRTGLRVCPAFRPVSDDAAFAISGVMPIGTLANEMTNIYKAKFFSPLSQTKSAERERFVNKWQEFWECLGKGQWTHIPIPTIKEWLERRYSFSRGMEYIASTSISLNWIRQLLVQTAMESPKDPADVFFDCLRPSQDFHTCIQKERIGN